MNMEFTHVNNMAIIKDENGNTKIIPYYDNLYEVLINENCIEEIEKKINLIFKDKDNFEKNLKYFIPTCTLLITLATYFLAPDMCKLGGFPEEELNMIVNSRFGLISNVDLIRITMSTLAIPIGVLIDIFDYSNFVNIKKRKNGTELKLKFLKTELSYRKERLEKLKQNKTNTNEQKDNDFETINICENPIIKAFNNRVDFYYKLGYDEKKLYKYYLKEKLDIIYTDYYLELAKKYFEENGPALEKKYKK